MTSLTSSPDSTTPSGQRALMRVLAVREVPVLMGLIIVVVFFAVTTPVFLTSFNLIQLVRQIALLLAISLGMTFVISAGEIDISVGAIYNLAANVMALLIAQAEFDPWIAALGALLVGALAGLVNGILSAVLRLPTLIVTLGTVSLYRGTTILLTGGLSVGNLPRTSFFDLGSEKLGPVPLLAVVAFILVLIMAWIYGNTIFAKHLLAIGSNAAAARRTGVRLNLRKMQVMTLNGVMCGSAAILGMAYLRSASPQSGTGYELLAIAAVVIGGTPLQGGAGTIWGTLIGISLILVIQNGLILLGLPAAWQVAATGAMILIAVAVQQIVRKRVR